MDTKLYCIFCLLQTQDENSMSDLKSSASFASQPLDEVRILVVM